LTVLVEGAGGQIKSVEFETLLPGLKTPER
jgi:hypothetical protein